MGQYNSKQPDFSQCCTVLLLHYWTQSVIIYNKCIQKRASCIRGLIHAVRQLVLHWFSHAGARSGWLLMQYLYVMFVCRSVAFPTSHVFSHICSFWCTCHIHTLTDVQWCTLRNTSPDQHLCWISVNINVLKFEVCHFFSQFGHFGHIQYYDSVF